MASLKEVAGFDLDMSSEGGMEKTFVELQFDIAEVSKRPTLDRRMVRIGSRLLFLVR